MGERKHQIAIRVGQVELDGWLDYRISNDMLEAADEFRLSRPMHLDAWNLCQTDAEVQLTIDGTVVVTGYIGARECPGDGRLHIAGFCKAGRLVKESAQGVGARFGDKDLITLAAEVATPTFQRVLLSNAENRRLVKGRGHRVETETTLEVVWTEAQQNAIFRRGNQPRRVEAGIKRWQLLEMFVREMGALMWASADGESLIIGQPAYDLPAQYRFHESREGSNVARITYREDIEDAYSMIVVPGSGRGSGENFGLDTHHVGVAKDHPDDDYGVGRLFQRRKVLVARKSSHSHKSAQRRAEEMMAERMRDVRALTITAPHHGQWIDGARHPTIFGFDNVCHVRKEVPGGTLIDEDFYITAVDFSGSETQQQTQITAVPLGTRLV